MEIFFKKKKLFTFEIFPNGIKELFIGIKKFTYIIIVKQKGHVESKAGHTKWVMRKLITFF